MPDFRIEKEYRGVVAGIDEVGRGPWAGPVIAATVILPRNICRELMDGLDDSKKLSRAQREALHTMVSRRADIGIGCASVAEIEQNNILIPHRYGSGRHPAAKIPNIALIDGKHIPENLPCTGVVSLRGDSLSLSIAAASIVAKVTETGSWHRWHFVTRLRLGAQFRLRHKRAPKWSLFSRGNTPSPANLCSYCQDIGSTSQVDTGYSIDVI